MSIEIKQISAEQTWPVRHEVMWPDMPFEYVKVDNDKEGIHFGLFVDQDLVSVVSLFLRDNDLQFRKFATLVSHQGNGYGTQLLTHALNSLSNEANRIWCNARVDKQSYYHKFGLKATHHTFTKGGIDYVIMEKLNDSTEDH